MSKPSNSKKPPKRPAGRPKRGSEVVTPEVIEQIAGLWLQGHGMKAIGDRLGINRMTVHHHLNTTIRPAWQEDMRSRLAEDLAKVRLIEKIAWQKFESTAPGETVEQIEKALLEGGRKPRIVKEAVRKVTRTGDQGWLEIVKWCIEFRAKIYGHFAPSQHRVNLEGELRVAGESPSQVDAKMLEHLKAKILERRIYQSRLDPPPN